MESLLEICNMTMEIKWIPEHVEVNSKEKVDKAAKLAPNSEGQNSNFLKCTHKPLKSARSINIKQDIKKNLETSWQSQTHSNAKQL